VKAELEDTCDEVKTDRLGNVIGLKLATGEEEPLRVVLAAHCDEIGMMVKHIDPDGYIRFHRVGGLYTQALTSQVVTIHGREKVKGVIVPDFNAKEMPTTDDLLIDIGMSKQEALLRISVGDPITLAQEMVELNEKVVMGRNFDDRIGTYCMLEAMRRVGPTSVEVYAVSTVQEEVGVRGMPVAAYSIEPHIGIALDGSLVQGAYSKPHQFTCEMGKGAGVYVIDNLTIADKRLLKFLYSLGDKHEIPYQRNIGGGTDASALQRTKGGAIATTIGAPVRYMHSTVQLCHIDDIEATIELLRVFLEHADEMREFLV